MKRREFLATSAAAALGLAAAAPPPRPARAAVGRAEKQWIELRTYRFASAEKQRAYEQFLAAAAVPALNRAGVEPVGVFKLLAADNKDLKPAPTADGTDLYVLLPHKSADSLLALEARLAADQAFQEAGRGVVNAP